MRIAQILAIVTLMATGIYSGSAFAGGLSAPLGMDSASVMPQGIRSLRVGGFTAEISDKYDGSGTIVPLANKFNKAVTWKELIDSQPAGFERGQFKGGLQSLGVNLEDVVGDARGMVNTRVTATVPSFAYGFNAKTTLGVGVPVIHSNVSMATGWSANAAFQAKLEELSRKGLLNKVLSYETQLQNVVATKISNYGYKPLVNEQRTEIGDLNVVVKHQLAKGENWAVAVQPRIVVPTGRVADVDKVVDVASGDGQWDIGVLGVVDYFVNPRLTTTYSVSYTHQIEGTKPKRIPTSSSESLSKDLDPSVREKIGDIATTAVGARYKVTPLWTTSGAYSLQYKQADEFHGNRYAPERYGYLSNDTEQNLQAAQVGVTFSTIPLFQAKKFAIPLEATISFASALAGRNVNQINLTSFELVSFF